MKRSEVADVNFRKDSDMCRNVQLKFKSKSISAEALCGMIGMIILGFAILFDAIAVFFDANRNHVSCTAHDNDV